MKKHFFFIFGLAVALCSCHHSGSESLIGTWVVDKVNVAFDERNSTPELVKQVGEMEKQNTLTITDDSLLVFQSMDSSLRGQLKIIGTDSLTCDGQLVGVWKSGNIIATTTSPLGEIVVTYRKK